MLGMLAFLGLIGVLFHMRAPDPDTVGSIGMAILLVVIIGMVLGCSGKRRETSVAAGMTGGFAAAIILMLLPFLVFIAMVASCLEDCRSIGAPKESVEREHSD